jgi:hypothetical protein
VQVDRQTDELVAVFAECPKREQHVSYRVADILAPVRCREHELLVRGQRG